MSGFFAWWHPRRRPSRSDQLRESSDGFGNPGPRNHCNTLLGPLRSLRSLRRCQGAACLSRASRELCHSRCPLTGSAGAVRAHRATDSTFTGHNTVLLPAAETNQDSILLTMDCSQILALPPWSHSLAVPRSRWIGFVYRLGRRDLTAGHPLYQALHRCPSSACLNGPCWHRPWVRVARPAPFPRPAEPIPAAFLAIGPRHHVAFTIWRDTSAAERTGRPGAAPSRDRSSARTAASARTGTAADRCWRSGRARNWHWPRSSWGC